MKEEAINIIISQEELKKRLKSLEFPTCPIEENNIIFRRLKTNCSLLVFLNKIISQNSNNIKE